MNSHTWKLPIQLFSILVGVFAFAFLLMPNSAVEAACGVADPSTATFYFPMEATGETNQGTGGAITHGAGICGTHRARSSRDHVEGPGTR